MANELYNHDSGVPQDLSRGTSIAIRQEFDKVEQGFEKLPTLARLATNSTGFVSDTGGPNAFVLSGVPAVTGLVTGMEVRFQAANANTGAATINVNGIGVRPVVRTDGNPLELGDIFAGQIVSLVYDSASGGRFQYTTSAASATSAAKAYATQAADSATSAFNSATAAGLSATAASGYAGSASGSAVAAAQSASDAQNAVGSVIPGFVQEVPISTDTVGVVDRQYEFLTACKLTLPAPSSATAGRYIAFINTSSVTGPTTAPLVDFGTAPLNRGASPGLMRVTGTNVRRLRGTSTAPWGWVIA